MKVAASIMPQSHSVDAPLLSIVVPSFNCGQYLRRALDSVAPKKASHADYEVVIVDNLSTDETVDVLRHCHLPNVRIIRERDEGQSDALNKGFRASKGKWLCWLNADDEFVPGSLPHVINALRSATRANWLGGGMVWIDERNRVLRCSPHLVVGSILRRLGVAHVGGPSSFFRKTLLHRVGPFSTDYHYCMDTEMWHRFQWHGERCYPIHRYVWAFRVHEDSKTSHVLLTASRSPRMTAELDRMKQECVSPLARHLQGLIPLAWRAQGLVTGRDWQAYRDTRRYRGLPLTALGARGMHPQA
jgi:glycosyltransferase involved in cell wall biosynthesis